jgi:FtsZ-interacting cell division protein ZipA
VKAAIIIVIIVAVIVIAVGAWMWDKNRKRAQLRERFGPEYDRTVEGTDDRRERRAAESELADRAARRDELELKELNPAQQHRYLERWREIQAAFVDEPGAAVRDADVLVRQVMDERGYPVDNFETQADLISVDHPNLVEDYRRSHEIALRHDRNEATTDDLRRAFIHHRSLFEELLGAPGNNDAAPDDRSTQPDDRAAR